MTKNILICVDGESYLEMGERKFDEAMDWVGITLKKDSRSVLKWSDVYWSFRSYDMDVRMIEGTIPDDMDMAFLDKNLRFWLGEAMRPIIFIHMDREDEE